MDRQERSPLCCHTQFEWKLITNHWFSSWNGMKCLIIIIIFVVYICSIIAGGSVRYKFLDFSEIIPQVVPSETYLFCTEIQTFKLSIIHFWTSWMISDNIPLYNDLYECWSPRFCGWKITLPGSITFFITESQLVRNNYYMSLVYSK